MTAMHEPAHWLLTETLRLGVPLEMQRLSGAPVGVLIEIARQDAQVITEKGDEIQFRSKGTARATAALIRGLAAAALVAEGGVTFAGLHWCTDHAHCLAESGAA